MNILLWLGVRAFKSLRFLSFCFFLLANLRIQLTLTLKPPFPSIYELVRGNLSSPTAPAAATIALYFM